MSSKNERKKGLGRGLSSFLEGNNLEDIISPRRIDKDQLLKNKNQVPIEYLEPNINQPRKSFSTEELEELALSIKDTGIIQPIIVREKGERFEIVAGERRWRSAQIANLHEVPVIIKDLSDEDVVKISIVENVQRVDLNPVEEASSLSQLISEYGYTQEKMAGILGKSRSYIANALRLLSLPDKTLSLLRQGRLTSGHGRALIGYENADNLALKIVDENLSVREVEALVKLSTKKNKNILFDNKAKEKDVDTLNLEQDLKMILQLKTQIIHNDKEGGGKIILHYKNLEDLDGFCSKVMKSR